MVDFNENSQNLKEFFEFLTQAKCRIMWDNPALSIAMKLHNRWGFVELGWTNLNALTLCKVKWKYNSSSEETKF